MFGNDNFPKVSSISVNNVICHAIPYKYIPNYYDIIMNNKKEQIKIGDMFAIEPILSNDDGKVTLLEDGFTYIINNGSNSAHFERVVLITENRPVILNDNK